MCQSFLTFSPAAGQMGEPPLRLTSGCSSSTLLRLPAGRMTAARRGLAGGLAAGAASELSCSPAGSALGSALTRGCCCCVALPWRPTGRMLLRPCAGLTSAARPAAAVPPRRLAGTDGGSKRSQGQAETWVASSRLTRWSVPCKGRAGKGGQSTDCGTPAAQFSCVQKLLRRSTHGGGATWVCFALPPCPSAGAGIPEETPAPTCRGGDPGVRGVLPD